MSETNKKAQKPNKPRNKNQNKSEAKKAVQNLVSGTKPQAKSILNPKAVNLQNQIVNQQQKNQLQKNNNQPHIRKKPNHKL